MGLKRIQTCDNCGEERSLREKEQPEVGGWRSLNANPQEATFCNTCVTSLVTSALEKAKVRGA